MTSRGDWTTLLVDQLDFYWTAHLWPRLQGLTDAEYFWEPVAGCWTVRRDATGRFVADAAWPEPNPAPVTTIAWRLGHVIVGVLGARVASHFGGPPVDYQSFAYAGTAAEALDQLDEVYDAWNRGVDSLGADGLARPCGASEGPYADRLMAALVLHINREVIHHGAEVALLRDLYLRRP